MNFIKFYNSNKKYEKILKLKNFFIFFVFIFLLFVISLFELFPKNSFATIATWELVGSAGFSEGSATYISLAIDSNNIPYVAYYNTSKNIDGVVVMKYSTSTESWELVGSAGFSEGSATYISLAIDSNNIPYVAYYNTSKNIDGVVVMKYSTSTESWELVGSAGFSEGSSTYTSLAIDSNNIPYVAYQDGANSDKATVMKYSTSTESWELVGSAGFSDGSAEYISLAIDSNNIPYVAYRDGANSNYATVMKYSTSTESWELVGSAGFSAGFATYTFLAIDSNNVPYVAFSDSTGSISIMKYNGSVWEYVDQPFNGVSNNTSIAIDSNNVSYVAFSKHELAPTPDFRKAMVRKYNGSSWVSVGDETFSDGPTNYTSLAIDGNNVIYVAYKDVVNSDKVTVMKYIPDTTSPVITILGSNPELIYENTIYTDSGATAIDTVDGDLTNSIITTNEVNTSILGSYLVTYVVSDTAGNITTSTRTVNVISGLPGANTGSSPIPPYILESMNESQNQDNNNQDTDTDTGDSSEQQNNNQESNNNQSSQPSFWTDGRFIKAEDSTTIYFVDSDNIKHEYPDTHTWESYFKDDFSKVETVSKQELNNYLTGDDVPHKIGSLIKITSSPKVYKVTENKVLRWIINENVATRLFGNAWNKLVRDISEIFFGDYTIGENIE